MGVGMHQTDDVNKRKANYAKATTTKRAKVGTFYASSKVKGKEVGTVYSRCCGAKAGKFLESLL